MNYFSRFKKMMRAAKKAGYFQENPAEDVAAKKGRENKLKDILTPEEFDILAMTVCPNPYISQAFLFCMLTGIRGESARALTWGDIYQAEQYMSVIQGKTGNKVDVPLLPQAMAFLPKQRGEKQEKVFKLPATANGCNKMLKQWVAAAGIDKNITWHCARHSVGSLLKRKGASIAQIADILGQRSTRYAERVYTRMTQLDEKRALMEKLVS
jgi:integrase